MSGLMRNFLNRRISESEVQRLDQHSPIPSKAETSESQAEVDGLRLVVFRDVWEGGERRVIYDSASVRVRRCSASSDSQLLTQHPNVSSSPRRTSTASQPNQPSFEVSLTKSS